MDFIPFASEAETGRWWRHLPHWEQSGCTYFVTFRTADSIPAEKLNQWKSERDEFERNHPKPWSDVEWRVYRTEFLDRIERWSDRGYGAVCCAARIYAGSCPMLWSVSTNDRKARLHAISWAIG